TGLDIIGEYCAHARCILTFSRGERRNFTLASTNFGELSPFNKTDMEQQWNTYCSTRDFDLPMEELMLPPTTSFSSPKLVVAWSTSVRGTIIHRGSRGTKRPRQRQSDYEDFDFGLARHGSDFYVVSNIFHTVMKLFFYYLDCASILWMPPDAITPNLFPEVGRLVLRVTLWEVFSLAATPFDRPNVTKFSANAFA
ncbi:hypothetical protein BV898_10751, partial [Hypsibius exemplaris]